MPNYQASHRVPVWATLTIRAENEDEARDRIWRGEWDRCDYSEPPIIDEDWVDTWSLRGLKKVDEPDQAEVSEVSISQQEAIHLIYDLRSVATALREIARDLEKQPFGSVCNDLPMDTPIEVTHALMRLRGIVARLDS